MKLKVYTTKKTDTIVESLRVAEKYFGGLVELSPLNVIKSIESKKTVYETVLAWALNVLTPTKSISTAYLETLDSEGYDGVALFLNKKRAKETSNLFGQHTKDGKSYIEVYDTTYRFRLQKNKDSYIEIYTPNRVDTTEDATSHGLIHEILHALSSFHNIPDQLHAFIMEGHFDTYLKYLQANIANQMETNSEKLYKMATSWIGKDITPSDVVPDVVACAITVNTIHEKTFGDPIGGTSSTYLLYNALLGRKDFKKVDYPERGDIIISPTGYAGAGGTLKNGHVGIVGDNSVVLSNDSNTGLLATKFTLQSWSNYYQGKGKFPVFYFHKV